jgi:hypothetical protein
MATRLLERVPMQRISEQAQPVHLGRLLLTVLVGVLYVLGWLAAKTVIGLGVMLGWTVAAARTGWQDAYQASADRRQRARPA